MVDEGTVQLAIANGPSLTVPWTQGMNAQQVLEAAQAQSASQFSYALEYYGNGGFGYLVNMINDTYDSFQSQADRQPFYFWQFLVDGVVQPTGIDGTIVAAGSTVGFAFTAFNESDHAGSALAAKYDRRT